ncbi:MAG: YihY/virulence factor BrkB family protein, partial [Clostridia bacterium]|nr:YihY/virulence factor BrkB family protein [Deltaproteobacteria bacterium]
MLRDSFNLLKETASEWLDDNASSRAAAVAYYTLISMAPLLLIVVAVSGFIFGEQAASGELFNQLRGMIGEESAKVIQTTIENARDNMKAGVIASVVNVGVLLFGASGVFAELQDALNQMWSVAPRKSDKTKTTILHYLRKRTLSFAMVLVIAFLLLVSLVVSAVLATLTGALNNVVPGFDWFWQPVNFAVSFAVITTLFAMMYKVLPDAKVRWRDTIIGAAITSLLFSIGKLGIGLYLGNAGFSSTYGAAGAVVVTVVWVYYSAQILFFGA